MTDRPLTNVAASVRQRLLNRARAERRAFQELATLYAMERFLFRLGRSPHAERFVLKGGLMTLTWAGEYGRVTRDIDLLGRGANSVEAVVARLQEVLEVEVEDGLRFDTDSLSGREITVETACVGMPPPLPGWTTRSCSTSARPGCSATPPRRRWPRSSTPSSCSG